MEVGLNFETDSVLHSSRFHEICVLRTKILTFRQNEKESIGVAWARFILLEKSGPDLSLPEHLLL